MSRFVTKTLMYEMPYEKRTKPVRKGFQSAYEIGVRNTPP